ncbi:hypothetical protein HanXRQr2_Chr04g0173571 [Helianthus annuus]|uniref:Chloramphenicol acetyltransferase-like domain-containing protein n=1 Tax=Helianthus annuus TaxID=4232 RepID=A0A9K3NTG0_HELAN|nr:hypothetical protein HanXRQr2_Chr04g0173571 [Helianthus annuus]KAJ0931897.1 hypothetical protein HanPSC8_Chr04g0167281 [Helianthus annuus]
MDFFEYIFLLFCLFDLSMSHHLVIYVFRSWRIYVWNFASYMPVTLTCDHHVIDGMCCYGYNYVSKWIRLGNGSDGYIC